jgi:hypothetical protein
MSELPAKLWLRRGEVREYLQISEQAMTKLIASGVLVPMYFKGQVHAYFGRAAVLEVKPEPKEKAEGRSQKAEH